MNRDRQALALLIKNWAQDHNLDYQIKDIESTDQAMRNTSGFFTWLIENKESKFNGIDLLQLLDRLEIFMERKDNRPDGMFCKNCQIFYHFAEPNQSDGTLLCYSCRNNPFI